MKDRKQKLKKIINELKDFIRYSTKRLMKNRFNKVFTVIAFYIIVIFLIINYYGNKYHDKNYLTYPNEPKKNISFEDARYFSAIILDNKSYIKLRNEEIILDVSLEYN